MASRTSTAPQEPPNPKAKVAKESKRRGDSAEDLLLEIENTMGQSWLPEIYRDRILKLLTRSYVFPAPAKRKTNPEIQHTLLGIELKVGQQRMLCPDLATARYLAIFARAGCEAVAIPYDITMISHLADELESSWHRMLLLADNAAEGRSEAFATRVRSLLVGKVRKAIVRAGAGTKVPEFKQSTKQGRR